MVRLAVACDTFDGGRLRADVVCDTTGRGCSARGVDVLSWGEEGEPNDRSNFCDWGVDSNKGDSESVADKDSGLTKEVRDFDVGDDASIGWKISIF